MIDEGSLSPEGFILSFPFVVFQCPQCSKRFKHKDIVNLYAPEVAIPKNELEKVCCFTSPLQFFHDRGVDSSLLRLSRKFHI